MAKSNEITMQIGETCLKLTRSFVADSEVDIHSDNTSTNGIFSMEYQGFTILGKKSKYTTNVSCTVKFGNEVIVENVGATPAMKLVSALLTGSETQLFSTLNRIYVNDANPFRAEYARKHGKNGSSSQQATVDVSKFAKFTQNKPVEKTGSK